MPNYSMTELGDLEEKAEISRPIHQSAALIMISRILEQNGIAYGVMGGMNFYLRGSKRTTGDVDIAVDNPPRMDALLDIFNNHPDIYRPGNKMQWLSGVARLFVRIQVDHLVQVDLKPKGSEGNLIPTNLAGSVESISVSSSIECQGLAIGPLVAAKIKAHYGRETADDYHDLQFVCRSAKYAPEIRKAAPGFRDEWKMCFLEKVLQNQPQYEQQIREALHMERSPSPESTGKGKETARGGGSGGRGGGKSGGGRSRDGPPKQGEQSNDRYWTYSAKEKSWYHVHSDGKTSWNEHPSGVSKASKTAGQS